MIEVEVTNQTDDMSIDSQRLVHAVEAVFASESITSAEISIAIVDDARIHELNRRFLDHDYPTDVLSFPLSTDNQPLQGEIAVSLDTARSHAARFNASTHDELLLYVVHGTLHLVGYDDKDPAAAGRMQARQNEVLRELGVEPPAPDVEIADHDACDDVSTCKEAT